MLGEQAAEKDGIEVVGVVQARLVVAVGRSARAARGVGDMLLHPHRFGECATRRCGTQQPVGQQFEIALSLTRKAEGVEIVVGTAGSRRAHPIDVLDALLERGLCLAQEATLVDPDRRQRAADRRKRGLADADDADVGRFHQRDFQRACGSGIEHARKVVRG